MKCKNAIRCFHIFQMKKSGVEKKNEEKNHWSMYDYGYACAISPTRLIYAAIFFIFHFEMPLKIFQFEIAFSVWSRKSMAQ